MVVSGFKEMLLLYRFQTKSIDIILEHARINVWGPWPRKFECLVMIPSNLCFDNPCNMTQVYVEVWESWAFKIDLALPRRLCLKRPFSVKLVLTLPKLLKQQNWKCDVFEKGKKMKLSRKFPRDKTWDVTTLTGFCLCLWMVKRWIFLWLSFEHKTGWLKSVENPLLYLV